ncbi:hypothetical protein KR093_001530 [Drosophila rubida]|uniref:Forkhead box protein G1 n=1 Tax=Drosophila rubida TaxID=30044 RepID=A0AAD4K4A8_9MUSC|nr:hypothetical protein KR093_001530 [Drosophila rubida]
MSYYDDERRHHHHHHHHGGRPIVEVDIVPPRIPRPVVEIDVGSRYPSYRPEVVEVITPAAVYQPPPPPRPIVEVEVMRPNRPLIEFNIGGRRPPREEVVIVQQQPRW